MAAPLSTTGATIGATAEAQESIDPVALVDGIVSQGEEAARLVKHAGQLYELVEPDDLRSLTLNARRVCVHGKLGSWQGSNTF